MILLRIISIDYVKICSIFSMHFMVINNIKNEMKGKNAAQKLKFSYLNRTNSQFSVDLFIFTKDGKYQEWYTCTSIKKLEFIFCYLFFLLSNSNHQNILSMFSRLIYSYFQFLLQWKLTVQTCLLHKSCFEKFQKFDKKR